MAFIFFFWKSLKKLKKLELSPQNIPSEPLPCILFVHVSHMWPKLIFFFTGNQMLLNIPALSVSMVLSILWFSKICIKHFTYMLKWLLVNGLICDITTFWRFFGGFIFSAIIQCPHTQLTAANQLWYVGPTVGQPLW